MAAYPVGADQDPRRLLAENRRLTRQVRAAQRATWFPLLVLAALTFLAVPVYGLGGYGRTCATQPGGGRVCAVYSTAGLVYWPIALVLAYVAIAVFYLRRARTRGVGTRVLPYAVVGIVLAVVSGTVAGWLFTHPPAQGDWIFELFSAASAFGLALLALAVVERSWALAGLAIGYVVLAFLPYQDLGWVITHPSPWDAAPRQVLGGSVLLVAGLLFALAQRRRSAA
jgi:hypothetical protein